MSFLKILNLKCFIIDIDLCIKLLSINVKMKLKVTMAVRS